jgi:pilus assembly protein CpaC
MLRVTVAEVNRAALRSIGVNFVINNSRGLAFANLTGNVIEQLDSGSGLQQIVSGNTNLNLPAVLDNGQVFLAINALRNLNFARSLAEPVLTAMNGQAATFQAGGQFPVPVVTGFTAAGLQGVSYVPFGVQLSFTPFVTDKDRIRLVIGAEVSTRDLETGTTVGTSSVPGLNTRNFNTTVELREGQTLAVAGLLQSNYGATADRVPFFGDLPIIGRFAAFDRATAGEQELVILISPELVHPVEPDKVQPLPGSDIFEPGDLEFYLLGRLESRRSADYRSPVRTDFHRMVRYTHCEDVFIGGPHGYAPPPVISASKK